MDPKAQIVGEFVMSIRVPGYFPPLPELRQQLRTMVHLMDEPAPRIARVEHITIPGPVGAIPGRVYAAAGVGAPARLKLFDFEITRPRLLINGASARFAARSVNC